MARGGGRAARLGALAVAAAIAIALGAVADAQVVVDPCLANKKKACLKLDSCQWTGKGGGCKTPANMCAGIQKKKLGGVNKKRRCNGNPACRCSKKRKCGACVANVGVTPAPAPGPVADPAPGPPPNTKYTTAAWCATYMNDKGMENPCMMYSDLNGYFNQISMGSMAKDVYRPFPPTADPPVSVPGKCSDGPTCPSGGAGTYTKLEKCGEKLTADVKYVTLGGSGLGAPSDKPKCPYTSEPAMSTETLKAMVDAQGAQGVDLDLEVRPHPPPPPPPLPPPSSLSCPPTPPCTPHGADGCGRGARGRRRLAINPPAGVHVLPGRVDEDGRACPCRPAQSPGYKLRLGACVLAAPRDKNRGAMARGERRQVGLPRADAVRVSHERRKRGRVRYLLLQ